MNRLCLLVALLLSALVAALPASDATPTFLDEGGLTSREIYAHTPKCKSGVHIIGVPGNDPSESRYGMLAQPVAAVKAAVPDSSSFAVLYPTLHEESYPARSYYAATHLRGRIMRYSETCPATPIVLMGYSFGAVVLLNLLCGHGTPGTGNYVEPLSTYYQSYIIAAFAFGDESRVPGQSYDRGTCINGQGVHPRTNSTGCDAYASLIRSYCDEGDPQCCGGASTHAHHMYGHHYDGNVTTMVRHQVARRKKEQ